MRVKKTAGDELITSFEGAHCSPICYNEKVKTNSLLNQTFCLN